MPDLAEPWTIDSLLCRIYDATGRTLFEVDDEEIGRRIVACVNYCRFLPDSMLQGDPLILFAGEKP